MATILDLVEAGRLSKLEAGLGWKEQEYRQIFVFPTVQEWLTGGLPSEASSWNLEISPIEQLEDLLIQYCSGRELIYEWQFSPIRHILDGVWELKTADMRLFGWFAMQDCFICSGADMAYKVKEHDLYAGYRNDAVRKRNRLDLNEPKFIAGDNPYDVISTFRYPE